MSSELDYQDLERITYHFNNGEKSGDEAPRGTVRDVLNAVVKWMQSGNPPIDEVTAGGLHVIATAREPKPTAPLAREYIRPADVVRMTGCSKSFVMQAIWSGNLRAFQVERSWLIPRDAVRDWIEGDGSTTAKAGAE